MKEISTVDNHADGKKWLIRLTLALFYVSLNSIYCVMKQECSVIVRWRDFIIPLILLLIVSLVCQSDRELDDRSH